VTQFAATAAIFMPNHPDLAATIAIEIAYSAGARQVQVQVQVLPLRLPAGSTAADALKASNAFIRWPELAHAGSSTGSGVGASTKPQVGVWGRRVVYSHVLHDGDRLEIYRPLRVDPKVARRERFAKQGARTTGLFAQRRLGGKAGY
jgi:uncharacterized protein